MKKFINLMLCLMLQATHGITFAEVLIGHVVGIADGDTITVFDASKQQHKNRLMGIDAPEKAQAFGQRSKQSLSDLVYRKSVSVEWSKKDKYGRIVGKITTDGLDVCLEQVKRGMAWHYKQYEREQSLEDRSRYADAELDARAARRGLWADLHPIQPSDFRHHK